MTTFLRQISLLSCILILHFVGHTLTFAQPEFLYYNCTNSANYTSPSTYQTNLNTLLSSLSSNIDRYGYYNSSIGKSPDIVTAVVLCRGDVQLDICRSCVDDSISKLTQVCPNQKEAIAWYDKCMLRYTNQTIIFGTMERDPGFNKGNDKLFVPNEYMNAFVELRTALFVDVRDQAASGDSLRKYATGDKMLQIPNYETMYSLVQCTPDLSKGECSKCITACVDLIPDCCNKSAGGAVYKPTCNLRYELGGTSAFYSKRVSATFTFTNKCDYTVWPGLTTNAGTAASLSNTTTGFALKNGDSNTINVPSSWNGRIWGRSLCSEDSTGNFTCVTGDCGSNKLECAGGTGPSPPTTLAEISLNSIGGQDFYDVSLVDGYNLPMLVEPQGGTGTSCLSTGCVVDLNGLCPSDLKVTMITAADGGNNTVACRNACQAFQEPQYCCTGEYATPETCNPSSYSIFKNACPRAYSYAFDDATSTFTCGSFPDYLITFCPYPTTTSKEPSTDQGQGSTNTEGKKSNTTRNVIIIVVVSTVGFLILVVIYIFIRLRKINQRKQKQKFEIVDGMSTLESLQYDFDTVKVATDNFSDANKLGQGGFGSVYKGILPNGHEFAVKRLSQGSGQGEVEFKNEVLLMAKLQHRNLVRLLGFCLEGIERLLIYEFVINGSLDHFIFDKTDREKLDWEKRNKIIGGIARGLLYLHEDSRLRIIHRDLKASNILLDEAMAAKIADFGMAMCFVLDESHAKTSMVAGTYGYMAPEVLQGQLSVKSDVFSFGVLVLEIVSGNKITKPFGDEENAESLLSYAWRMWREGTPSNLIDPTMKYSSSSTRDIMRCIHIGLLCVQENVVKRPNMATVVLMLSSISFTLAVPTRPAFSLHSISETEMPLLEASHNEASITELHPR